MFGKLNKLKQAVKFAQKASKGFPMNRRKFMQGVGSLALSTALPGGVKVLPKGTAAAGTVQTLSKAPWINGLAKTLEVTKGTTILDNGGTVKLIKNIPDTYHTKKQFSIKTVDGESDLINYTKSKNGDIDIEFDIRDDYHNNQHILIDGKTKNTEIVDENYYMTSPEDYAKDDPIIHEVLTSQKDIGKRYGLAKGDTIDGEMIDRLAIPRETGSFGDSAYSTLFERHADTFSPSGNLFKTKQIAETYKKSQQTMKKNREMRQMDDWESQFRGGSMHGYNIGGAINKLRTVGSLTKGLKPAKTVGNISKGQMKLPKPRGNDLSRVRTDIYEGPKGPFSISDERGVRILDRDFDKLEEAQKAVSELSTLRTQDPSTFRIFGARPAPVIDPLTKNKIHIGAKEIVQEDASRMPAMFWKSRENIAEANQNVMSGRQWLAYLKNKGVGDTELKDTSLGYHLLTNGNVKMSKMELLKEFDELAPQIDVKMLGLRDEKSTIKDAAKFIDSVRKAPPIYMDSKSRRMVNDIYKTMKRIDIDRPTTTQMDIIKGVINKNFKSEFGIDQIIGKGFDPNIKMPFMAKKMALVFDDVLNQGGLKYKAAGKPKHAGDQTMSGGTNYQEMLFSYKPGKLRTSEPLFTEGHDFGGQKPQNMFVWVRFSDRTDEYGRKLLFVEEIQSDMHATARAKGTFSKGYSKRGDLYDPDSVEVEKIQNQLSNIQGKIDDAGGLNVAKFRKDQAALIKKAEKLKPGGKRYKTSSSIPEGPLADSKDHGRFVLQYLLRAAKESGDYDGIALSSAKVKGSDKSGFYDKIMIPQMKKISKKSGAKFDETVIVDGEGMPYDEIPVLLLKDKKGIVPTLETSVYNEGGFVSGGLEPIVSSLT